MTVIRMSTLSMVYIWCRRRGVICAVDARSKRTPFRREHLTEEDVRKNKAIVTSIQRGTITYEDLQVR